MKLLSLARDLQRRKARERHHLFVAEGVRAAEELLRSPLAIRGALASPALAVSPRGAALRDALHARAVPVQELTDRELADAADTESPQGVLVIAAIPRRRLEPPAAPRARVLLLDALQDPGNVGTILRTAAAFGVELTLALPGTVDLWNAKVVRSAMGALFHRPVMGTTWEEADAFLAAGGFELWGADGAGTPLPAREVPARLALAVGNEGSGLTDAARARVARRVAIPIAPDVESLNVAVATGILLYELRP
ncbi:MAG TPA: RNA methyltransferase [Gemmatimonadaceae bacterium]|nr:RNA methyltransferase [Gemmatimonadaceae bacterium]